jgi:peptidyl-tRNA hydrolase, PTH1 family
MKIIVGLGNPGNHYRYNRHNVGFRCIDELARENSITTKKVVCQSDTGSGTIEGTEVMLAKPRTFVNLSGKAVTCLLDKFHAKLEDLIVIHDDLDLPTGRLRIRLGGKSGGHRGVRSIIDCTGSETFYRIRIGISRPQRGSNSEHYDEEIVDYVLGDLSKPEEELMQPAVEKACNAIDAILHDGIEGAMNKFNKLA